MTRILERPRARQELEDIALSIGRDSPEAAQRFLAKVRKLYGTLAVMPEMGSRWKPENPCFAGVRYFPIPRYPKYVIFYRPLPEGDEEEL